MKTKFAGLVIVAMLLGSCGLAAEGWLTDFGSAKKIAAKKNIPILVNFSGSDWCGWCIRLDKEVFTQESFKAYAKDSLVLLVADFPSRSELPKGLEKQNKELAAKYGVEGFPTLLLLDKDGNELARTGYRPGGAEAYIKHLKELILEAAKDQNQK